MKVFTATHETQGRRDNDFCWAVEGELVFFPPVECERENVDGDCGCHRAMAGVASHRATTTIKVVDREDLDPRTYLMLISEGLRDQGYVTEELMADPEVNEWLSDVTEELMHLADALPAAAVVERRGEVIRVRQA